ncbi:hypothetical protein Tco_0713357 [Tanacetum coccineum]
MQKDGRGTVTGHFRRSPTDQVDIRGRIIAEKVHKEKAQQDKLKEVKAHLNFERSSGRNSKIQEVSQHSESRTPNIRGEHGRGQRSRRSCSMSRSPKPTPIVFSRIRRDRSESPKHRLRGKGRSEGGVFNMLGVLSKSEDNGGGHWKSRLKKQKSSIEEDDLSQPRHLSAVEVTAASYEVTAADYSFYC